MMAIDVHQTKAVIDIMLHPDAAMWGLLSKSGVVGMCSLHAQVHLLLRESRGISKGYSPLCPLCWVVHLVGTPGLHVR